MKNSDVNTIDVYTNGLKGMTLAATMLTFCIVCNEIKEEWPDYAKVKNLYRDFDKSSRNDLNDRIICSEKTRSTGKIFLKEIKAFKQLPEANEDDLKDIIKNAIEITISIIS